MPFAYLAVEFESTDGEEHAVEIYSDLSAGPSQLSLLRTSCELT